MFGSETLEVLIGLVTVYLVFGIACTAIVEAVASWLSMRSTTLESALKEFLDGSLKAGTPFVDAFYAHPLVQALSKGSDGRPSYVPPEIVGQVVQALVMAGDTTKSLADAVQSLPDSPANNRIKGLLDTLVAQTGGDAAAFRKAVETHFDAAMDRASGWFKRQTQNVTLIAAAVLVIGANVDTVDLAKSLAASPAARAKLVDVADQYLKKVDTIETQAAANPGDKGVTQPQKESAKARDSFDNAVSTIQSAGFQFGWNALPTKWGDWIGKIAGLLVSIFAVSLGAPFWFDVLQRFMRVRAAGAAPGEDKK